MTYAEGASIARTLEREAPASAGLIFAVLAASEAGNPGAWKEDRARRSLQS